MTVWVCCHYKVKPGHLFKEYYPRGDRVPWWRQVKVETMERRGWQPVKCVECDNPAIQMDHLWPYERDYTLCEEHLNAK